MDITNLIEKLTFFKDRKHSNKDAMPVILIKSPCHVGGSPTVNIKTIYSGIDWDANKIIIEPEIDLQLADHDYLASARKQLSDMGWTAYEFNNLKRENARLRKELAKIKDDNAST